ncbi:MAG: 50S ribosomal protein L23 [Candidatus Gorgyraea atricola]|nr:50S ribosomal protein L23 [Candidatus Gorgyraea atricola]
MKTPYDILKNILRTEKGSQMLEGNKYLFRVAPCANKIEIKQAVEFVYNVKVLKVNTVKMRGKWKRLRYQVGKTPDWKKAIVTLKTGDRIEMATT